MEFDVSAERLFMFNIFGLVLLWNMLREIYGASILLFFILFLIMVVISSFRYKFEVGHDQLVYRLLFFKKTIYIRKLAPSDISQIRFVRLMWAKKTVLIKVKSERKIRLVEPSPSTAFDHLMEFADKHEVELHKTRDYLLLERKKERGGRSY
ncbi:hypothetical protein [Halobacillus sp. K22]|uniref:hypothetical protein n=1 Tax=Halobacillus sp. K22 TaxID=3457431 RepID=UPI003FCCEF82